MVTFVEKGARHPVDEAAPLPAAEALRPDLVWQTLCFNGT